MDYIERVLGLKTVYKQNNTSGLPNHLDSRYFVREAKLDGKDVTFVYPKAELEAIGTVWKHLDRIKSMTGSPAIPVLERLTSRRKEYLLRERIPFIAEGKQIYLPFMATYLQQKCDGEKADTEQMLPSAQLLLLYYIYRGCGEALTSDAAQALSLTATSLSRASRQLEQFGLISSEKRGVQKVLYSDKTPAELFDERKDI